MAKTRQVSDERARKTLYLTGFNPKLTTKPLLMELFNQGGPVADVTLFETHAYILFQHEDSIPYCLALFSDIELHGNKLRLSPRIRGKGTYSFVDYLTRVRNRIRDENLHINPPNLPPKKYSSDRGQVGHYATESNKRNTKKNPGKKGKQQSQFTHERTKGRTTKKQRSQAMSRKSRKKRTQ